MRASWSGVISFGLVNIPVSLYAAADGEGKIDFDLLHKRDLSPIRHLRICQAEGKPVPYHDVVRGVKIRPGHYVIIHDDDIRRAYPGTTKSFVIEDFVREEEIDPMFFDRPFYVEPRMKAGRGYALLIQALNVTGRVGIGRFVMRNREYLGMLRPLGDLLIVYQLRFFQDLRRPDGLKVPRRERIMARDVDLAAALIEALSRPFRPELYKNRFADALRGVIAAKAQGGTLAPKEKAPLPTATTDLAEALRQSLDRQKA